jgi:AraC-like DNA-binding protein
MTFDDIVVIVSLVNCVQSYALCAILVLSGRGNKKANRALALLLFCMTNAVLFHVGHDCYNRQDFLALYFPSPFPNFSDLLSHLIGVQVLIFAPIMALYTRLLTGGDVRLSWRFALESFPSFFFLLLAIKELIPGAPSFKTEIMDFTFTYAATAVSLLGYLAVSFRRLRLFSESAKSCYSSMARMNYTWLRIFLGSVTFVIVVALLLEKCAPESKAEIWCAFAGILTFVTAIYGFLNPGYFSGSRIESLSPDRSTRSPNTPAKYAKSALALDKAIELEKRVLAEMETGKPFLNPELSLFDLADKLGSSSHALSQVLNDRMKMTFYDFINLHRIEEAKRLFRNPATAGDKVVVIAMDAGFNSLSTFNAVFRKFTDMTPSEFRKNASNPIG